MRRTLCTGVVGLILTVAAGSSAADGPPGATVADLAWMSGAWAGSMGGDNTLEENWIQPTGGSIASLVRMTGEGKTSMVELIVIEEEDNTLVLRIQQWDPGFNPRSKEPQKMILSEIGERMVKFTAASEGGLKTLSYSSPTPDTFNVNVLTSEGGEFQIPLKAR